MRHQIAFTLNAWATALDQEPRTLEKAFLKAGFRLRPKQTITIKELMAAKMGDESAERIRNLKADADKKERLNKIEEGELIKFSEFASMWTELQCVPLRSFLQSVPATYDVRCNSQHPETAREALTQLRDDALRILRDNLPKPAAK